jgi:hypothetical protein
MSMLNPKNMPPALVSLIPMAEKWGIGDDGYREHALELASADELGAIVHCIDGISDEDFYGWLAGPEARNPHPSVEYLTMSCLALAIDSATVMLQQKQKH